MVRISMRKTLVVISLLAVFFLGLAFFGGMTRHGEYRGCTSSLPRPLIDIGSAGSTELTVLFDNNSYDSISEGVFVFWVFLLGFGV
jgi:hypothetical protein